MKHGVGNATAGGDAKGIARGAEGLSNTMSEAAQHRGLQP
jgi:hypothetical protein